MCLDGYTHHWNIDDKRLEQCNQIASMYLPKIAFTIIKIKVLNNNLFQWIGRTAASYKRADRMGSKLLPMHIRGIRRIFFNSFFINRRMSTWTQLGLGKHSDLDRFCPKISPDTDDLFLLGKPNIPPENKTKQKTKFSVKELNISGLSDGRRTNHSMDPMTFSIGFF